MTLEKKISGKLLAIDLDGDINTLVYAENLNGSLKVIGIRVITLLGIGAEEKERYLLEKVTQAIKELQITNREAYVSFRGASLYLGRHTLPVMPLKEIPNALRWQFKEIVSSSQDEIIFDYEFAKETTQADGAKNKHFTVALGQRKEIDITCNLLTKYGLIPSKINVSPFCTANLLPLIKGLSAEKIYATLEIGYSASTITCYQQGKIIFSRLIPIGAKNFIKALGIPVVYKDNQISLNELRAWQALAEVGIPQNLNEEWQGFPLSQMLVLIRPELERLVIELNRSLEYFIFTLKENQAEKIFLTGIGASIKGLGKFLSENVHIPSEILPIPVSGEIKADEFNIASSAIGNILSRGRKANLLPLEYKIGKILVFKDFIKTISLVFSVFILLSLLLTSIKIGISRRQLDFLKRYNYMFDRLSNINEEVRERDRIESLLRRNSLNFAWVLKDLAQVIPSNAMLAEANMDNATRTIELKGIIFYSNYPENTLTDIMNKIEGSKMFREARLDWMHKDNDRKIAEFKIKAGLK